MITGHTFVTINTRNAILSCSTRWAILSCSTRLSRQAGLAIAAIRTPWAFDSRRSCLALRAWRAILTICAWLTSFTFSSSGSLQPISACSTSFAVALLLHQDFVLYDQQFLINPKLVLLFDLLELGDHDLKNIFLIQIGFLRFLDLLILLHDLQHSRLELSDVRGNFCGDFQHHFILAFSIDTGLSLGAWLTSFTFSSSGSLQTISACSTSFAVAFLL
jgi:hypothetical protein